MVLNIMNRVMSKSRTLSPKINLNEPPNQVLWVQTFGPETPMLQSMLTELNAAVSHSTTWSGKPEAFGIVSRRGKNLGDLI